MVSSLKSLFEKKSGLFLIRNILPATHDLRRLDSLNPG